MVKMVSKRVANKVINPIVLAKTIGAYYEHAPREWGKDKTNFVERFRNAAKACENAAKAKDVDACIKAINVFYKKAFFVLKDKTIIGEIAQGSADKKRKGIFAIFSDINKLKKQISK